MQDGTERNTGVPVINKVGLSTPKNKEQIHTKVLLAKSYFACLPFQRELCFKSSCLSKVAHSKEMNPQSLRPQGFTDTTVLLLLAGIVYLYCD